MVKLTVILAPLQALAALELIVADSTLLKITSVGQAAAAPVQASAGSQAFIPVLQIKPAAAKILAGQAADTPVHVSATSHTPAEALHTVPAAS
jgi:hypothetical protein